MGDLARAVDEQAELVSRFREVFRASWREPVGRHWPNLAGDVEALCEQARRLGLAQAGAGAVAPWGSSRRVAEPGEPFGERE